MTDSFREKLSRLASPEFATTLGNETERIAKGLSTLLASAPPETTDAIVGVILSEISHTLKSPTPSALNGAPFEVTPVPREVFEQALREIDEEEIAAEIREIRETGGFALRDFYHELDFPNDPHERVI